MDVIIVLKLGQGEEFGPVILPLIDKDSEILFQLLVYPFGLAIALWVVGGGCSQLNTQHSVDFPSELCYKLGTPV